ncbi:MAG: hypothetical protein ABW223_12775 [Rariglobus sp.]
MAFLILLPSVPTGDLYFAGVKKRLLPINEAAYVSFAQNVRTLAGDKTDFYAALRDLEEAGSGWDERQSAAAFLKILEGSVFADWPREMLSVRVEPDSVSLTRGSGMLGRMGVEIFDRAVMPKQPEPAEVSAGNPYRTDRDALSGRVLFIRGD